MRILQVISGTRVNGAIVHCVLLARDLALRGHEVTVICRPGAWAGAQLATDPVAIVESDLHRWPLDELRRVARLVGERRIHVVHTHMSRAHFFGVLLRWLSGVPVVATAHNRFIQAHWMFNDRVIAVSEAVRRFQIIFNRVSRKRIAVIHPFVQVAAFRTPSADMRRFARAALGLDPGATVAASLGNIFPEKRTVDIVRAFARARASGADGWLVLIGDGPADYKAQVRAEAVRCGVTSRIVWAGQRHDVPHILSALDLLVVASQAEPFGLAALEAMAAGLPVVATAVGGLTESVVSGATGLVVPPRDVVALGEAMATLMGDAELRRRFGDAGRRRVGERFSAETQVPKIEAVLASVAGIRATAPLRRRAVAAHRC